MVETSRRLEDCIGELVVRSVSKGDRYFVNVYIKTSEGKFYSVLGNPNRSTGKIQVSELSESDYNHYIRGEESEAKIRGDNYHRIQNQ